MHTMHAFFVCLPVVYLQVLYCIKFEIWCSYLPPTSNKLIKCLEYLQRKLFMSKVTLPFLEGVYQFAGFRKRFISST